MIIKNFKILLLVLIIYAPALIYAPDIKELYNEALQFLSEKFVVKAIDLLREIKKIETQNIDELNIQIEALNKLIELLKDNPANIPAIQKYSDEINQKRSQIRSINASNRPTTITMDLLAGHVGIAKTPSELYNEGFALLSAGNVKLARDKFRESKRSHARTIEDFKAQIRSLEFLIEYYTKTDLNPELAKEYLTQLVKSLDEAFLYSKTLPTPTNESSIFAKKIAQILISIFNASEYKNFDDKTRRFILNDEIRKFIEKDMEKYLKTIGSAGTEDLNTIKLRQALEFAQEGILFFKQAEEIRGTSEEEIASKKKLWQKSLEDLIHASQIKDDMFNVEYTLAVMFLNGWGTEKDFDLASKYINNAVTLGAGEYKKQAQDLKLEIDASILMKKGFEKWESARLILAKTKTEENEREKLKKEAFELLREASDIFKQSFATEFILAQMYHDADGTEYDPARAKGHLRTALNLAKERQEKVDCGILMQEIDQRDAQVQAEIVKNLNDSTKEEKGFMRVGIMKKPFDRTEVMRKMFKQDLSKNAKTQSLFNRLFGTSKTKASFADSSSSSSSAVSVSRSSIGVEASSSSSSKQPNDTKPEDKRKSKSPFSGFF